MEKVNLAAKPAAFDHRWAQQIVASCSGDDAMVAKLEGEFVRHAHPETDGFFPGMAGGLDIELRERTLRLGPGEMFVAPAGVERRPVAPGEMFVAPAGVEHRPVARGEVPVPPIEPAGTPDTGGPATAVEKRRP